jgi:hypothetical protein
VIIFLYLIKNNFTIYKKKDLNSIWEGEVGNPREGCGGGGFRLGTFGGF